MRFSKSFLSAKSFLFAGLLLAGAASPSAANILIEIDKSTQQMVVSVDGVERYQWPVSTGRVGHDTPEGTHRAFRLERDHFSKEWDDAPMPHSIFFTKRGHAIHGSYDTKRIGSPASAGCVRLDPKNAERLFALVEERGVLNATVVITGDVYAAVDRQRNAGTERRGRRERARRTDPNAGGTYAVVPRQRNESARLQAYPYVERRYYSSPRQYAPPTYYYSDQYGRTYRAPPRYQYQPQPYYGGGWN